ncbi:aldose epimerase family protein [Glaciimonas immobilis]|nr:aldose epimerase family protein [Glaciimonas immobilis]KAF3996863.1 galactose mutarotase [Glaciimonas immobilis]
MIQLPVSSTKTATGEILYTLRNASDMRVVISNRGGTLISWHAPDRYGRIADVLLGYPDTKGYVTNLPFFGGLIGRWANRIADGHFMLDGADFLVDRNNGTNHLHGGDAGFHLALWDVHVDNNGLRLRHTSKDGEAGFPGNLQVEVRYRLDEEGELTIDYQAITDAPTPVNLTSHAYFNLNGGCSDISDHMLSIDADYFLKVDQRLIPTERAEVAGSTFDFRQPSLIGPRLASSDAQLGLAGGFDHCYCLHWNEGMMHGALREVAQVYDPGSGRALTVATTETGLQFYSGNFLDGVVGRGAQPYAVHDGFCLEAQAFPDQINGPDAEAVILRPGQIYRQTTVYRLSVRD